MRFKNLTGEPNGQLVVDGLAETLSARLAHFSSVQVMRPATPEALADANPQQVARDLGANVVLTGSMQRAGDRLRVAWEIIDLAHGTSRSGDLIEGSASELFTIQDRLTDSIAASLHLGAPAFRACRRRTPASRRRATSKRSVTSAATTAKPSSTMPSTFSRSSRLRARRPPCRPLSAVHTSRSFS